MNKHIIPAEIVENRIFLIRNQKVMLDSHLAELYGVTTKALNQAVKRNRKRFPAEFTFQLTEDEARTMRSQFVTASNSSSLRSQSVTLNQKRNVQYRPYAFTKQGVAMLSSVLKSDRAIQINILIMKTFVKIRELMATHIDLARKIEELDKKYGEHDKKIQALLRLIKALLAPPPELTEPEPEKPPIGFYMSPQKPKKPKRKN